MTFFIDIQKTEYCLNHNFFPKNYFDIFHAYFYLCLLPYELKNKFLKYLNLESQKVFEDILKINLNLYSIEECDFIVDFLPLCMNISNIDLKSIEPYLKNEKKIVIFQSCDNDEFFIPNNINNVKNLILFSTSGYKSKHSNNVLGCPTFNNDYYIDNIYEKKLSVGFCGIIDCENNYNQLRKNIVYQLKNSSYFHPIIRNYWGNNNTSLMSSDQLKNSYFKQISKTSKKEFIDNIQNNLYTLCVRGGGNYSFRLAETFMMGRIPILIDSDCILPFSDKIQYDKNTVYVTKNNSKNFSDIDTVIKNFHYSHSPEEIINIQRENRNIWLEYFKIDKSFYKTLEILKNY